MYYKLHENFLLRGWQLLPYGVVNRTTGDTVFVNNETFTVLDMANGRIDFDLPLISDTQRKFAAELVEKGVLLACNGPEDMRPEQKYQFHDNRYMESVHWSITGRCNYKCKHCYMSACENKYGELSHDDIMRIIEQLAECGVHKASLTGGEALVRKDFFEIVDALRAHDIVIRTVYSNGQLVNERVLGEFEKRGMYPEFNMSFDGTEGWHSWLRGVKDADAAIERAFLLCREHGFRTGAEMCLHEKNKHTLRDSINYLASLDCRSLKTNPISDVGAWKDGGYGESISMKDLFEVYLEYIPHYYEDGKPLSLQLGGFFMDGPRDKEYRIPALKQGVDPDVFCVCGHARSHMYISAEGRVLTCMSLSGMEIQKDYPLLLEHGLRYCLTESTYINLITKKAREVLEHNAKCHGCEYAKVCCGGCRAAALDTTPEDILGVDEATCLILRGGYIPRIRAAAQGCCDNNLSN